MKESFSIEKATPEDSKTIFRLIKKEFPYFGLTETEVAERLGKENITVFKARAKKNIAGFIELEQIEQGIARINGLTIKESFRGKNAAKTLLSHSIEFLKGHGTERVTLLVKQSNQRAKALYKQFGFEYSGLYEKKIDGATVEKMELSLFEPQPTQAA